MTEQSTLESEETSYVDADQSYEYEGNREDLQDLQERRSERITKGRAPDRFQHAANIVRTSVEPRTRDEALNGPDKDSWIKAMDGEMAALKTNKTWVLEKEPNDKRIIGCKWVFKKKQIPGSNKFKFKARLVAQGFSQQYGTDYEVFAPVVRPVTLRTLLVVAGKRQMHVRHYDAKTAFLNGDLEETIYMRQPQGYQQESKTRMACRLTKSLG